MALRGVCKSNAPTKPYIRAIAYLVVYIWDPVTVHKRNRCKIVTLAYGMLLLKGYMAPVGTHIRVMCTLNIEKKS